MCTPRRGFTLIELSVVLIVLGLVAGGILVGRELVKVAEIRATVAQVEKFNTAVMTFREKYQGTPGDLHVGIAAELGLFVMTGDGAGEWPGSGNGNGLVETRYIFEDGGYLAYAHGETLVFWRHLSEAGLLAGQYGQGIDPNSHFVAPTAHVAGVLPRAAVGRQAYFAIYADSAFNYYEITAISQIVSGGRYIVLRDQLLASLDAAVIDAKIDDGKPFTGIAVARGASTHGNLDSPLPSNNDCTDSLASDASYSPSRAYPGSCALRIRMQ